MDNKKGTLVGKVVDNKQIRDGTIKVLVSHKHKHPKYNRYMERTKYYFVHVNEKFSDEQLGDKSFLLEKYVFIIPCAPKSKRKRFEFGGMK